MNKKPRAIPLIFFCRIAAPVLKAIFYASLVIIAVIVVALPIIALANVSAGEMLLPPFMHQTSAAGVVGYSISLGNGLVFFAAADAVSVSDIKLSIYLAAMLWVATLAATAPVCRFISKLCANIRDGKLNEPKNSRYVIYTGLTVILGKLAVSLITGFYNYKLVALFASATETVSFAPDADITGILSGFIILLLGFIWLYMQTLQNTQKSQNVLPEQPKL